MSVAFPSPSRACRTRTLVRALVGLLLAAAPAAPASEPAELITDRPDQTESASVVPLGTLQVESGGLAARDESAGATTDRIEGPSSLVRWGQAERWELRLAWSGRIDEEVRSATGVRSRVSGNGDPEVGLKVALAPARGVAPELALIAHLSLPLGGSAVGSPRADPSVRIAAAHDLGRGFGLGWNLGLEAASFEDGVRGVHTLARWIYTMAVGRELGLGWGAYLELFGDLPASDSAPAAHSLDGGLTWRPLPRLQIDLAAGIGLDEDAVDRFVLAGLSFRIPH